MADQGAHQASAADITAIPTTWLLKAFHFFFPIEHDTYLERLVPYLSPVPHKHELSSHNFPDDVSIFSAHFTSWEFPSMSTDNIPATSTCGKHGNGFSLVMCPLFEWYCPCHAGIDDKCRCDLQGIPEGV